MNAAAKTASPLSEERLVRVYVWQWPVRISHWLIFLSILVLSGTGYYLYDPFIISRGPDAFLMGTMRFIHEVAGFVFFGAFLLRLYWFFRGNRWARWSQFVLIDRHRWRGAQNMIRYYLFLRREPESRVGHNPLAGATYSAVYAVVVIEILTGLALFNHVRHSHVLGFFIGWLSALISIQYLREIHFLGMFIFWAFFVHHLYSAWLMAIEERSGLVGSIFSGYKNLPADFVAADPASRRVGKVATTIGPGEAWKSAPEQSHAGERPTTGSAPATQAKSPG